MFDNKYPYTDFSQLNLDWFLLKFKELLEEQERVSGKVKDLDDTVKEFTDFVTNYFDNLDVQAEVNVKLNEMAADGTLSDLLAPLVSADIGDVVANQIGAVVGDQISAVVGDQIDAVVADQIDAAVTPEVPGAVTSWLNDNVDPVGSAVVVDSSLLVSGAAADAKATGDFLRSLSDTDITWIDGKFLSADDGREVSNASYATTDWIELDTIRKQFFYSLRVFNNVATYVIYDENKQIIEISSVESAALITVSDKVLVTNEHAKYIRFCSYNGYNYTVRLGSAYFNMWVFPDNSVTLPKVSKEILIRDDNGNFINYNTVSEGNYIKSDGSVGSSSNVNATDFIPLNAETTYYYENIYRTYYAFYNSAKEFVASYSTLGDLTHDSGSFTTPANTAYGRFTILDEQYTPQNAWISQYNKTPLPYRETFNPNNIRVYADKPYTENPCDYDGDEICTFNKCLCIGDSLTSGTFNYREDGSTSHYVEYAKYAFPKFLQKLTNIEVTNKGRGGYSSAEWYQAEQNTDLSGYDIAIIQLGVNDQIRYSEFGDTSKTAFTNIFNKLKTENKNIKIFVANIIPATSYSSSGYLQFSADLLAWVQTINQTDPDIIPLDMQQYGHTKEQTAYNCGHLSAYGYYRLAKDYKAYISKYMSDNPMLFSEIQFIGTDYQYHA